MANKRVHELAKEFGMTSKELLEHLHAMKIPAKNHASTLIEPYVDKIRKDLADVITERLAAVKEERKKKEAAEEKKRQEEETLRREEEEHKKEEEEKQRLAQDEAHRKEEERKKKETAKTEEETKQKAEEEAKRNAEEEAKQKAKEERTAAENAEAERYRQMARDAEATERQQRILAEAQAVAVASHKKPAKEKKAKKSREKVVQETPVVETTEPEVPAGVIAVTEGITVGDFADLLGVPHSEMIKRLMTLGEMLTVNQVMSNEAIELLAEQFDREVHVAPLEAEVGETIVDAPEDLRHRPPVVTVMGHVDHGKTSLLDAIRETGVAEAEAGGITQHIGASVVFKDGKQITFIDTPGHEAFTAMRARGANMTDIAILVVAADDGVMPQTVEAIHHVKAAGVPMIVAVNKIDKPGSDPNRVRQELTEHEIVPEDWGGDAVFVDVSAKERTNIEDILGMILLVAEVQELKANPDAPASGVVVEAKLDRGRGPVATVLVQRGTLGTGDAVVAGTGHGRVRALIDPLGHFVDAARPADPVEILGLSSLPAAGDEFRVMADERSARQLAEERNLKRRLLAHERDTHVSLDDLFARIQGGKIKDLNIVLKADTQGSIEAIKDTLDKIDQTEVRVSVLHSGVGGITETDVTLADASDAIIIGFNVRPEPKATAAVEQTKVDMRLYTVIYQVVDDINAARVGMLAPEFREESTAMVEVRETFKVPKMGTIAGCYVLDGEVTREDQVRLVRDGTIVFDGRIGSLRRFKDDVKSVKSGYECGIGIKDFGDVKIGDVIEAYRTVEVAREV